MNNRLVIGITFIAAHFLSVGAMESNIPSLQQLCLDTLKDQCDIPVRKLLSQAWIVLQSNRGVMIVFQAFSLIVEH